MQFLKQDFLRFIQQAGLNPALLGGKCLKQLYCIIINITDFKGRQWQVIPRGTVFTHQKRFQRRAIQNLFRAAAPVVIDTLIGNTDRISRYIDFNIRQPVLLQLIDSNNNPHAITDLIRDFFHQPFGIFYANNFSVIVTADIDLTTLSVGKTAHPFQVFIAPGLFIFDVLRFSHEWSPFLDRRLRKTRGQTLHFSLQ